MGEAQPILNRWQRQVVGTGLTVAGVAVVLVGLVGLFGVLKALVTTFSNVLLPLALAMILATLLRPVLEVLEGRLKIPRGRAVAIVALGLVAGMVGALLLVVPQMILAVQDLISTGEAAWQRASAWFVDSYPRLAERVQDWLGERDLGQLLEQAFEKGSTLFQAVVGFLSSLGADFARVLGNAVMWLVTPIYLVLLLYHRPQPLRILKGEISFIPQKWRDDLIYLGEQFSDILIAFFRGQVAVAFFTAIILAVGYAVLGVKGGLLIGFASGMANLIPYLGTTAGGLFIVPYVLFSDDGGALQALVVLAFFVGVQLFQDYVMVPKIMGERTGLGPMTIIFSAIFWGTALNGLLGVLLAVPLTAFFIVFWRLAKERYLPNFSTSPKAGAAAEPST